MQKKVLKYIILIAVAGLLGYNSVYFKKLDAPKNEFENSKSDPAAFARLFWDSIFNKAIDSAITSEAFENEFFQTGAETTINKYSHSQGVSDVAYMLQKFSGKVKEITEDKIVLSIANSRTSSINCNVGNYFGNGVRDVTGQIKMGDFSNSMDFNIVSSELNKLVKTKVILPAKNRIKINDSLTIVGCVEIRNGKLENEILPVKITMNN